MAVKIRLARWGARKNPYYHIVASDSRSPRDGKFLETVGKYDPMVSNNDNKYVLKTDRINYWLSVGAQPTDKVRSIFAKFNLLDGKPLAEQTKKHLPKAKAQEKLKQQEALKAKNIEENQAKAQESLAQEEVKADSIEQVQEEVANQEDSSK